MTEISNGEKENLTNKRTDKQYVADLLLQTFVTQYNSSLSSFVPNFRILTKVVADKSLTEKKFTDRQKQTNRQTKKHNYRKGKNYIPPIYFVPGV